MIYKKSKSYKGLDCSEKKSQVRPRTFEGLASYAMKVANGQMPDIYPGEDPDSEPLSKEQSVVAEFLDELQSADKIERVELMKEFENFVGDLQSQLEQQQASKTEEVKSEEVKAEE